MVYTEDVKEQALSLIKYLYKNMPTYNQIKGSYLGVQYILNMLGLCTSITEVWSDRAQETLKNFAESTEHLFRADELNDVRTNIAELGKIDTSELSTANAKVKNYFLTSRFDIDFSNNEAQSFKTFNQQAATIIQVVNQIKPITRVLRKLYYILKITTELSVQNISVTSGNHRKIFAYTYVWNIDTELAKSKIIFDPITQLLSQLYLPFVSHRDSAICLGYYEYDENEEEFKWHDKDAAESYKDEKYPKYTSECTYSTLHNIGYKFKVSKQDTFTFALVNGGQYYYYTFPIESENGVELRTDGYGIIIRFKGNAQTVIQQFLNSLERTEPITSLDDLNFQVKSYFNLVPETDYLYQDEDRYDFGYMGLIFEESTDDNIKVIWSEKDSKTMVSEKI